MLPLAKVSSIKKSAPHIWNMPDRNTHFTGRENDLKTLFQTLDTYSRLVITGLGGMGKSHLAKEAAYRRQEDYSLVFWVDMSTLDQDYRALAIEINHKYKDLKLSSPLQIEGLQDNEIRKVLCDTLRTASFNWLLIIDNVEEEKDVRNILPQSPRSYKGHILITSRNKHWQQLRPLPLSPLLEEDSIYLLQSIINGKKAGFSSTEVRQAKELAALLGHLPLALTQSAFYIKESEGIISIESYIALAKKELATLWSNEPPPNDYPETVKATFNISIRKIQEKNIKSWTLLTYTAFLHHHHIPLPLIKDFLSVSDIEINTLMRIVNNYSLVEVDGATSTLSLHNLVQQAIQMEINEGNEKNKLFETTFKTLKKAFEGEFEANRVKWPYLRSLFLHGYTFHQHIKESHPFPFSPEEYIDFSIRLSRYWLYVESNFSKCHDFLNDILTWSEQKKVNKHTGYLLNLKGECLLKQGKYSEALTLLKNALRLNDDAGIAIRHNISRVYVATQQYQKAKKIQEYIISQYQLRRLLVRDDVELLLARTQQQLGITLSHLGEHNKALENFNEALAVFKKHSPDEKCPNIADTYHCMGAVFINLLKFFDAKNYLEKALQIKLSIYDNDENHPKLNETYWSLGIGYAQLSDFDKSLYYLNRYQALLIKMAYADKSRFTDFTKCKNNIEERKKAYETKLKKVFIFDKPIKKTSTLDILNGICQQLNLHYPFIGYYSHFDKECLYAVMYAPTPIIKKMEDYLNKKGIECNINTDNPWYILMIKSISKGTIADKIMSLASSLPASKIVTESKSLDKATISFSNAIAEQEKRYEKSKKTTGLEAIIEGDVMDITTSTTQAVIPTSSDLTTHATSISQALTSLDQLSQFSPAELQALYLEKELATHSDPNYRLLNYIASYQSSTTVETLIKDNKKLKTKKDKNDNSPVHVAVLLGRTELLSLFNNNLMDLYKENQWGLQPLYLALATNDMASVNYFIQDLGDRVAEKLTAITALKYGENFSQSYEITALSWAFFCSDVSTIKHVLKTVTSEDLSQVLRIPQFGTLVHLAVWRDSEPLLKLLLAHQSARNQLNTLDDEGRTPLSLAAQLGHLSALQYLLTRSEVQPNLPSGRNQWTPLHWAIEGLQPNAVEMLLHYVDPNKLARGNQHVTGLLQKKKEALEAKDDSEEKAHELALTLCEEIEVLLRKGYLTNPCHGTVRRFEPAIQRQYRNLVINGGGAKGMLFPFALQSLQQALKPAQPHESEADFDFLKHIQRVAGTSAGAITALFIALGCSPEQIKKLLLGEDVALTSATGETFTLSHLDIDHLLEGKINTHLPTAAPTPSNNDWSWRKFYERALKAGYKLTHCAADIAQNGARYLGNAWNMSFQQGMVDGDNFLRWLASTIETKLKAEGVYDTQKKRDGLITFREWQKLLLEYPDKDFKHLYVTITQLSPSIKPITLDTEFVGEYDMYADIPIADAIRASMSIPLVFKPYVPQQRLGNGTTTSLSDYKWVDGGALMNYPLHTFDKAYYRDNALRLPGTEHLGNRTYINHHTLGLCLVPSADLTVPHTPPTTTKALIETMITLYWNNELLTHYREADDKPRTVFLECHIKTDNEEIVKIETMDFAKVNDPTYLTAAEQSSQAGVYRFLEGNPSSPQPAAPHNEGERFFPQ